MRKRSKRRYQKKLVQKEASKKKDIAWLDK